MVSVLPSEESGVGGREGRNCFLVEVLLVGLGATMVLAQACYLDRGVVNDRLTRLVCKQLMKTRVIKHTWLCSAFTSFNYSFEKDLFDSLGLNEQLVESEEPEYVVACDLLGCLLCVVKRHDFEQPSQIEVVLLLDFVSVEVVFTFELH